jgi:hypothetical protein
MSEAPHYRFHVSPRFSANHLAEYLCTTNARQRTAIIREAKFPRRVQVAAYSQIKPDIIRFLAANSGDLSHFDVSLERLAAKARNDDRPSARLEARRCISAIEAFKEAFVKGRARNYSFTSGSTTILKLEGVSVHVPLDVGVVETEKGRSHSGGCVLFMSASADARKSIEDRRKQVASLVQWSLEGGQMEPLPRLCMSFDVFGGKIEKAPAAFTRLRGDMRDSCHEVAARWNEVEPPNGYDGPEWRRS